MGLFDKLKKDLLGMAQKAITDIIEDKIEGMTAPVNSPASNARTSQSDVEAHFSRIFSDSFSQYEVRRQIRLPEAGDDSIPLTFQLCRQGQPVLAVIVCDKHLYGYKRFRNTIDACQRKGLPVQCYYTQFRNETSYVKERLGQVLKN